jgi:phosphatidylserine/phosphatidylglycerophosphate/cardiolipin synthase-like enzyme
MIYNIFMRASPLPFPFSSRKMLSLILLLLVLAAFLALSLSGPVTYAPVSLEADQALMLADRGYFPEASALLEAANSSIHVVMYSLNYYADYPDSNANLLVEKLEAASKSGLDVRVLVDEEATDRPLVTLLKERGINAKFDSKETRTHAKLIIIDSKIIIIGSTNWSYSALDQNHEASVAINSPPLAEQFEAYFEKIWLES